VNDQVLPLGAIAKEIVSGFACGKSKAVDDGVLHLRPFSVTADGTISLTDAPRIPHNAVPFGRLGFRPGDILFNNTNSVELVGKSAVFPTAVEASFSNHMTRVRIDPTTANPRYVHAFLRHLYRNRFFEQRATRWIGQAAFGSAQLKAVGVPLPPLEEQQRIVTLLDRAAEIRRRADAARTHARAIVPALFTDMFGDPVADWPETTIEDLLAGHQNAIRTGPFGSQLKHSEFGDEGVPVLGIDNVVDNEFKWAKARHLAREKYERFKRYRVFPGDVIITIMGTTGRVCVAPDDLPECMNTKHLCAFTLDRSRTHPRFVWGALLFDPSVREQARGRANGQIMEGWNMGIVRSIRLRLPPLRLQNAFAEQAMRLEATARALDAAAAKAEAMAAALSAEVFDAST